MRCPTLAELPGPPSNTTGWPWTAETSPLPETRPDGSPWPRISIVTPNYNYGHFLEETIRSVLLQGYPNLEYVVIDGGSTDQSVEILKKYEPWLTRWTSEKDDGQAHAINKGLALVSGSYVNWLNSDDILLPLALRVVAEVALLGENVDLICGLRALDDIENGYQFAENWWAMNWLGYLFNQPFFPQDSTFFSRHLLEQATPLDQRLSYSFDVAFHCEALRTARKIVLCEAVLSKMKTYSNQRTYQLDARKAAEQQILQNEYRIGRGFVNRLLRTRFRHAATAFILTCPRLFGVRLDRLIRVERDAGIQKWQRAPL
ncbi:glycosyltransferase family 2 protein [Bradyrhizobium sp. ISRA436]|uniref:glycosyltransferase family 2 protein n=1 Tax=Bradyrhizobium sp. ISRA436 TaxID=2866195 RepID=UPI00247A269D|nr:glycosyltransferase family 2 protein [Bradyrhizobium sp. ISRA436]